MTQSQLQYGRSLAVSRFADTIASIIKLHKLFFDVKFYHDDKVEKKSSKTAQKTSAANATIFDSYFSNKSVSPNKGMEKTCKTINQLQ